MGPSGRCAQGGIAGSTRHAWPDASRTPSRRQRLDVTCEKNGPSELRRGRFQGWVGVRSGVRALFYSLAICYQLQLDSSLERKTGLEPVTFSLARRCSTTEPLPLTRHAAAPKR